MGIAEHVANADSDDEEDELASSGAAPPSYTADVAKRQAQSDLASCSLRDSRACDTSLLCLGALRLCVH